MTVENVDQRRLCLESIITEARTNTGLVDIGEPDILPGMRVLLDAYINEAHFTPMGIEAQRGTMIQIGRAHV